MDSLAEKHRTCYMSHSELLSLFSHEYTSPDPSTLAPSEPYAQQACHSIHIQAFCIRWDGEHNSGSPANALSPYGQ